jgi:hypothetical protein
LKCVVWTDPTEVRQAVELLPLWVDIDVDDALELLGKEFENRSVRSYAVNQLRKADDDVCIAVIDIAKNSCCTIQRIYYYICYNWYKHSSLNISMIRILIPITLLWYNS